MHEVYIERAAERDLKKLPANIFASIVTHVRQLGGEPLPVGCRKIVGSVNAWRIRVGEYRIIYEVDDTAQTVHIMMHANSAP